MSQGNEKSVNEMLQEIFKKKTWDDFFRTPCVKSSYLWGLGCGSIMVAHKLRMYKGDVKHAMNAGILTFAFVSGLSFLVCAREVNEKYEMLRQAFKVQKIQEDPNNRKPTDRKP